VPEYSVKAGTTSEADQCVGVRMSREVPAMLGAANSTRRVSLCPAAVQLGKLKEALLNCRDLSQKQSSFPSKLCATLQVPSEDLAQA